MKERSRPREIALGVRAVPYTARRSPRARRLSLRMLPGSGLEVVLPRGATLRDAEAFIRQQAAWVLRALDRQPPPMAPFADGAPLPLLGGVLTLRIVASACSSASATRVDDELRVALGDRPLVEVLEGWYRVEARRYFARRVAVYAATLDVRVGRLAIKDTRSRWGSCSSKGNLNFSWRLLLAPAEVADYVAAHEVAHLRELNHSARFWATVETLCPEFEQSRTWLRKNGFGLAAWPGSTRAP